METVHARRSVLPIFVMSFVACTALAAIGWEFLANGVLYQCTDGGGLDYLSLGDWVHDGFIEVPRIHEARSMSEPDQLLEGWSESQLQRLRAGCVFISIMVSACIASLSGARRRVKGRGVHS